MFVLTKRIYGAIALLTGISITLSACSNGNSKAANTAMLNLACQTIKCECLKTKDSVLRNLKSVKITWRPNGAATCPVGYILGKSRGKAKKSNY